MKIGDIMKNKILYLIIAFVVIVLLIVFIPMLSYKMSPNVITVKSISTESGDMTLSIECNNERGYFKKIKYVESNDEIYVYVIGTGYKFLSNKSDNQSITFSIKNIKKVFIKGQGEEILIYEFKDI